MADICVVAEEKKRNLAQRLFNRYRLTILNEDSYEVRYTFKLTPARVIAMALAVFILGGALIYIVVALTPLKQYLVPDFTDYEHRENANYSRFMVDSLNGVIQTQDHYIENIRVVLSGGVPADALSDSSRLAMAEQDLNFTLSEEDSVLRAQITKEDRYNLIDDDDGGSGSTLANLYLFKPLQGSLSGLFDAEIGHFGIDIVAPSNEVVKSVLDGTVILATYTSDGGNVIQVQHGHNLVSVYKHNSALFHEAGERVKAGESIAVIGNTGDHSDGPHLHFELWLEGVPVDPLEYFMYED
ncbi:MAG: murein DD-endopeptidase MepM/ murein hydrolase activator NlpD [Flavobacteriales bacterium]